MHKKSFSQAYLIALLLFIVFSVLLFSCGGGRNGQLAGGGIGGTGKSVGTITAFGSVFVNDFEYNTTGTSITVNGVSATEGDLSVGMKVILQILNGRATTIDYEPELIGPVKTNSIDVPTNSLIVLEQIVHVDTSTTYKNVSGLAAINDSSGNEDIIQISGFRNADGSIRATFVSLESPFLQEFEIKGAVSLLDTNARTFQLNTLIVDYSNLSTTPPLNNGTFVEVNGSVLQGSTLEASEVELESEVPSGSPGEHFELEGIITTFNSQSDFEVNGQPVLTSAQTEYENGTAADIVLTSHVEVEGTFNSSNIIEASKVKFK